MELRVQITGVRIPLMEKKELKAYRERLGLSQEDLAKQLRVARNTVSRWELGNAKIPEFLDLALQTIEMDMEIAENVRQILLDATSEGRWVSEEELLEKINQSKFWNRARIANILKNNLKRVVSYKAD